jgi:ketosteroid isomerase-like protein
MKRMLVVLVVCLLAVPLFADARADAKALAEMFEAGARAGDVERMVAPNIPTMLGTDAIRKFWSGMLQGGKVDIDLMADDFVVTDDVVVERGRYAVNAPVQDSGKYVLILRKHDGKWRAVTDIFNSDLAPAK